MKRKRYSVEQIVGAVKLQKLGLSVADICRKPGIAEATFTAGSRSTGAWSRARFGS